MPNSNPICIFSGLFEPSHMHFEEERHRDFGGEPSIVDMTVKAIQLLSRGPKGFFLMVEGHIHFINLYYI